MGAGYSAAAAGDRHTVALKADGSLWAWGYNENGSLGDGTYINRTSPVLLGTGFSSVAAGFSHTAALKVDGSLWAWGSNGWGQLGDGTTTSRSSPVQVGIDYSAVAASYYQTVGLKSDGSLWAWGYNENGSLGDGTYINRTSPVLVGTGFSSVAAGGAHTVALKADGSLWAWGRNDFGQLGDGGSPGRASPALSQKILPAYTLTLDMPVINRGTVTSAPSGLNCTSNCSAEFFSGVELVLTAVPTFSSTFVGWGGACTGTGTCTVTMDAAKSVTATFAEKTYVITTSAGTGGTVSCSPNPVAHGGSSTCTATPSPGYAFASWSGDCTGSGSCTLSGVTADKAVSASFTALPPTLSVVKVGTGTGTV